MDSVEETRLPRPLRSLHFAVGGGAANLMFQARNERYLHRRPMLFTTNKPLAAWGLVLHDPDLAD